MSETAPTNIEDKLASMQARVNKSNQEKADKLRTEQWLGFDPDNKDSLTDKQAERSASMTAFLNERPEKGQIVAREGWLDPHDMQNDTIESTIGEYEPATDIDIQLLALEQAFNTISNPEELTGALDKVSDFCDAHNLDRAAEKQLRERFLKISGMNTSADTQATTPEVSQGSTKTEEPVTHDEPVASEPRVESDTQETTQSAPEQETAKIFSVGDRVQLKNENGEDHVGEILEIGQEEADPGTTYYIIKPENGAMTDRFKAHAEDLTLVDDDVIIPEFIDPSESPAKSNSDQEIIDAVIVGEGADQEPVSQESTKDTASSKSEPKRKGIKSVDNKLTVEFTDESGEKIIGTIIGRTKDNTKYLIQTSDGNERLLENGAFIVVSEDMVKDYENPDTDEDDQNGGPTSTSGAEGEGDNPQRNGNGQEKLTDQIKRIFASDKEKISKLLEKNKRRIFGLGAASLLLAGMLNGVGSSNTAAAEQTSRSTSSVSQEEVRFGKPLVESAGPTVDRGPTISEAAKSVESGEGWFQTFKEFGIPSEKDQIALLKEIGPKLVSMGVAYEDEKLGGYGIVKSGELPKEAIALIQSVSSARGYIS